MPSEDPFLGSVNGDNPDNAARQQEEVYSRVEDYGFGLESTAFERQGFRASMSKRTRELIPVFLVAAVLGTGAMFLVIGIGGEKPGGVPGRRHPASLTEWDLVTDQDALHLHHIRPLVEGGPLARVPILRELRSLSIDLADETILSWHMKDALPIAGQEEFRYLQDLTDDCSRILDIDVPPSVYIKNDQDLDAYVTGLDAPHILVVTSELHERYQEYPDELRFIVGHELGHIKCDHVHARCMARLLIHLLAGDGSSRLRSEIVAPLLTLDLLHWCREAEKSADRSGLICVGQVIGDSDYNRDVAEQALLRLLYGGLPGQLDVDRYLDEIDQLEREHQFANVITMIRALGHTHPFIADRVRAIRAWSRSSEYAHLLDREPLRGTPKRLSVHSVSFSELPKTDPSLWGLLDRWAECDPILVVACGAEVYRTEKPKKQDSNPTFSDLNWEFPYYPGTRLVMDIRDSDPDVDNLIGSAVLSVREGANAAYGTLILGDAASDAPGPRVALKYQITD